jgi:sulfite oxidase
LPEGIAGRTIAKVELSTNSGQSWSQAELAAPVKPECWQLWTADIPVDDQAKSILVRATDSSGKIQPQQAAWNLKGYLYNGWQQIQYLPN